MKILKYVFIIVLLFCAALSYAQSTVELASEAYRTEDYKKAFNYTNKCWRKMYRKEKNRQKFTITWVMPISEMGKRQKLF